MEICRAAATRRPATITALAATVAIGLTLTACGSSGSTATDRTTWPSAGADAPLHNGFLQVLDTNDAPEADVVSIFTPDGKKEREVTLSTNSGTAIASYRDSVLYGGTDKLSLVDSTTGKVRTIAVRGEVGATDPVLSGTRRYTSRFVALDVDEGATDQILDLETGEVLDLAKAVDDPDSDREAAIVAAYASPDGRHLLVSNGTQTVLVRTDAPDKAIRLAGASGPGGFTSSGKGVLTIRTAAGAKVSLVDPETGALTEVPGVGGNGSDVVLARAVGDRVVVAAGRTVTVFDASGKQLGRTTSPVEAEYVEELADGKHLLLWSGYRTPPDWALIDVEAVTVTHPPALKDMSRVPGPSSTRYLLFRPGKADSLVRTGALLDTTNGRVTSFRLPAGGIAYSASADGSVQLFNASTTATSTYVVSAATGAVTTPRIAGSVSISPDGTRIHVARGPAEPALLTDATGKQIATVPAGYDTWTATT